jgi:hypothetical protein
MPLGTHVMSIFASFRDALLSRLVRALEELGTTTAFCCLG